MRAVIQRVKSASVTVDGQIVGQIERGLLILLGACRDDSETDLDYLLEKIPNMRIFEDSEGKMNLSLLNLAQETVGRSEKEKYGALVVSQFTLHADTRKGRRPSFNQALEPIEAKRLYDLFVERLNSTGLTVASGVFGAKMLVALENDGPVTIIIDSPDSAVTANPID